jgi:hypothetical protein
MECKGLKEKSSTIYCKLDVANIFYWKASIFVIHVPKCETKYKFKNSRDWITIYQNVYDIINYYFCLKSYSKSYLTIYK